MNNLLIVIIIYNPSPSIIKKIAENWLNYNYILVDNSDQLNQGVQCLINKLPCNHYIKNNKNIGIAAALNQAAQYAMNLDYNWILTMDQDSIITQAIIDKMLLFTSKYKNLSEIAIVSPRHVLQHGITVKVKDEYAEYSQSLNTMTSGNLLNLLIWYKIGGFEEKLFIDMVDIEYYCKAIKAGYKVFLLHHVYMKHELGNLKIKKLFNKNLKVLNHNYIRKYYQVRNSLFVYIKYRKYVPEVKIIFKFMMMLFITLIYEEKKLLKLRFMLKGILDFLFNKMGKLHDK